MKLILQNTVQILSKPNLRRLFNAIFLALLLYLCWDKFQHLNHIIAPHWLYLLLGILAVLPNYLLEIYKWQLISKVVEPRNFKTATKEVLRGLKLGLFTPLMAGDYVGRSMDFPKGQRSAAALLNFFNSITQTWTALFFGSIALLLWQITLPNLLLPALVLSAFTAFSLALLLGLRINRWKKYQAALNLPLHLKLRILLLSLLRTLSYNLQYYFVYLAFGIDVGILQLFIGANLLLLIKTVGGGLNALGDLTLRQVVSIFFFGQLGIPEQLVFLATFTVWFISIFLPILWGMFFYRNAKQTEPGSELEDIAETASYTPPTSPKYHSS